MTRYQQQVVKRMGQLNGTPKPEGPGAATLVAIVLMVGVVSWMFLVVALSLAVRAH